MGGERYGASIFRSFGQIFPFSAFDYRKVGIGYGFD